MKPILLSITNYRTIGKAVIPFTGITAATITGPNGAGKSSIVEALLWVLYGDGRSSHIDGVVRLGEDSTTVSLDYEHNRNRYKIIRKRLRGKRSELQYMVMEESGGFKSLSGASIRETQEKINADLAMDSKLFKSSSFILQGDSAGICEATPAERKAVLYQILADRLELFNRLHNDAKEIVKTLDEVITYHRTRRDDNEKQLVTKDDEVTALNYALERRDTIAKQVERLEKDLAATEESLTKCEIDSARTSEIAKQVAMLETECKQWHERLQRIESEIKRMVDVLEQSKQIEANANMAAELERDLESMDFKRSHWENTKESHLKMVMEYDESIRALHVEIAKVNGKIEMNRSLKAEIDFKRATIAKVPCVDTDLYNQCPLLSNAIKSNDRLQEIESKIESLTESLEMRENNLRYVKNCKDAENAHFDEESKLIGYSVESHRELKSRYDSVKSASEMLSRLDDYRLTLTSLTEDKSGALAALDAKESMITQLKDEHKDMLQAVSGIDELRGRCKSYRVELDSIRETERRVIREISIHEERLDRLADVECDLQSTAEVLRQSELRRSVYIALQEAFSRNGIPALIIDAAVPTLEEMANEVLSKLSDGKMSLKIITQKLKVSGGIAETLDIIVSDMQGERPYEEWSGGERLRIDLSIRIGLGRMLANRTGARIETLVLDEVCAPLDEAGENALVESIHRLQSRFSTILLITHRDSLRDRLPNQIIVSKGTQGSKVEVQ